MKSKIEEYDKEINVLTENLDNLMFKYKSIIMKDNEKKIDALGTYKFSFKM